MKALDADGGLNGEVRYSLSDDVSPSLLYVDERTGVLRLSTSLDREIRDRFQFTVTAADSADEPQSASAEVCYNAQWLNCRYCFYSQAKNQVFRPAGATRCTDSGQTLQDRRAPGSA